MEEQKLPLHCVKETEEETGYCLVFLESDGERTFLTAKGIEGYFSVKLVPEEVEKNCNVAAITGYYLLDETSEELVYYLRKLKEMGYKIILDPSPLVENIDGKILEAVVELSDLLTPNIQEAEFLASTQNVEDWALENNALGKDIIIKRGSSGGELFLSGKKIPYAPFPVHAVDTTGAGDSFTGAIAYCMSKGIGLDRAVTIAAACASMVTTIKGPHGDFDIGELPMVVQDILKSAGS
jgi:sugar/nucleoside kinase (ribokinase family)